MKLSSRNTPESLPSFKGSEKGYQKECCGGLVFWVEDSGFINLGFLAKVGFRV